jgi:uncharacterized protein YfaT (DUF1175 family)
LSFCEKNNLGVDPSPDASTSNISAKTSKKTEKNNSIGKNVKSFQKAKESIKNSYYNKYLYLEESNRSKVNNKNYNPLRQSKVKDLKKEKNNSMEKIDKPVINSSTKNLYNYAYNKKKNDSYLSTEKNENKIVNKRYNNANSSLSKSTNTETNVNAKSQLLKDNSNLNNNKMPKIKNLSKKENAYLILSYSNVLRLCERFFFSRSTSKLRESLTKKQILEYNIILLKQNITELENKINKCNEKLAKKFSATKIAEFTLNFITKHIEDEFKYDLFSTLTDDSEKKHFFSYIKLLYILLDENYDQVPDKNLIDDLYKKVNIKGYTNIKDYLYFIYIKNSKDNKAVENVDKINGLIKEIPEFLNYQNSLKYSKFISYNSYLIMEINSYDNDKVDTLKLKEDCINFIKVIYNKIKIYNEKNI